jgi:hypothetical protein
MNAGRPRPRSGILQNGLNTVTGAPRLRRERLLQSDLGLRYDDGTIRGRIGGFGVGLHHVREHGHRTGNLDRGAYSGIVGAESEPLPSILLLEDRLGIRFHEAAESPRWSIEWTARVVAAQRRVANSLLEVPSSGFTVCDVRGYWRVSDRLLATAGIENFTNANHREHLNFTSQDRLVQVFQPGWNAYAGAELTY